jgi:hypothetical protein
MFWKRRRRDREYSSETQDEYQRLWHTAAAQRTRYRAALNQIANQQPATLARLEREGVVFDKAPRLPADDWQQIAFWIYTDLCEVDTIARQALKGGDEDAVST